MKASLNRLVHYVGLNGKHFAAVITDVLPDGSAKLTVFPPGSSPSPVHTPCSNDEDGKAIGTWHSAEPDEEEVVGTGG